MSKIFPPQIAGMFYSSNTETLRQDILRLLEEAAVDQSAAVKALLVPHAGIAYAGEVSAKAYKCLDHIKESIDRVIIISPTHRYLIEGIAIPQFDTMSTPLGEVKIEQAMLDKIRNLPFVFERDQAFRHEHGVEAQLPFLQTQLNDFTIIPLLTGHITANAVTTVLDILLEQSETTLLVISSDLSHFHSDEVAREVDKRTIKHILNHEDKHITTEEACGAIAIRGFLKHDQAKHYQPRLLAAANSSDQVGDKDSVVGYAAFAFEVV